VVNRRGEQVVAGRSVMALQVAGLARGSYLVRMYNDKGELLNSQTFIKQ
jgi:hypothetical protein